MTNRQLQIINETYIKPIRSVIAVDDEFPTIDKLLNGSKTQVDNNLTFTWADKVGHKKTNANRLAALIKSWRRNRWMVDVHDGSGIGPKRDGKLDIAHIHQSDLVVLDFELTEGDRGDKSLNVLRRLAANPHFNLVIIYSNLPALDIFRSVRFHLISPVEGLKGKKHELVNALWIDEWSIENKEVVNQVLDAIANEAVYMSYRTLVRKTGDIFPWSLIKNIPSVTEWLREVNNLTNGHDLVAQDVIRWILETFQASQIDKMNTDDELGELSFSDNPTADLNWIRSDKIFITIVQKEENPNIDLVHRLECALCEWEPTPVRLIVSQIRSQFEEFGSVVEDAALKDRMTQAGWLHQILSTKDKAEKLQKISTLLERQTAALYMKLEPTIVPKAREILSAETAKRKGADRIIDHHYSLAINKGDIKSVKTKQEIYQNLNAYECSQSVFGQHLTTGHILKFDNNYWVCVTPSCDLVPDQQDGENTWRNFVGVDLMPVKVLRLWKTNSAAEALKKVNQNRHLFLRLGNQIEIFTITESVGYNPVWEQWFIKSKGNFYGSPPKVTVLRTTKGNPNAKINYKKSVHLESYSGVQVVAQLRYEYALNVLHQIGANMSRVGLDFVGYSSN
ncbi:MAG: hypothetical protein HQ483_12815 [Rhodospirillales bacterium]|nr:hypothetical protein [Rhodospirillales bacterium]